MPHHTQLLVVSIPLLLTLALPTRAADTPSPLRLSWEKNYLTLSAPHLPGQTLKIHYLEAYCRPGSTRRKWDQTTIGHTTRLLSSSPDQTHLTLECTLKDGVVIRHDIRSKHDQVDFQITATNPTDKPSDAHWAQPCVRLDAFTGRNKATYLDKCFIFLDGKLTRLPTEPWATEALYTPGQVWCPKDVDRNDVNPRPLSKLVPSHGLIGCFSADDTMLLAIAFEPYQELFQGVITCLHSDFRIAGLAPGETKQIRGKLYLLPNDPAALLRRYQTDFRH